MKKLLLAALLSVLSTGTFAQEVNYKGTAKCPEYWHMGEGSCQINFNGQSVYASGKRGSANWSECKKTGKDTFTCDKQGVSGTSPAVIVTIGKNPSIRGINQKL
jgi:hypothetical protein